MAINEIIIGSDEVKIDVLEDTRYIDIDDGDGNFLSTVKFVEPLEVQVTKIEVLDTVKF